MSLIDVAPVSAIAGSDRGLDLGLAQRLRQKSLDDGDFLALLVGEVLPSGLARRSRAIPAGFSRSSGARRRMSSSETVLPRPRASMSLSLSAGIDHAQGIDAALVAGLHRRFHAR